MENLFGEWGGFKTIGCVTIEVVIGLPLLCVGDELIQETFRSLYVDYCYSCSLVTAIYLLPQVSSF